MESEKQRLGHPKIVAWATVPKSSYATQKALGPAQAEAALEKLPSALSANLREPRLPQRKEKIICREYWQKLKKSQETLLPSRSLLT